MALSDARNLALIKATLTLLTPPSAVAVDPGGTVQILDAITVMTSEIATAEGGAIDNDQRPAFRLFAAGPWVHGAYRGIIQDLATRANALAP